MACHISSASLEFCRRYHRKHFGLFFSRTQCISCIVSKPCQRQASKRIDSETQCRMPVVRLPDDLIEQLDQSESGTINNTQGPGVAVYVSSDGRARADIYVGLKLDGLARYRNISAVDSNIAMQFALPPVVSCNHDDVDSTQSRTQLSPSR